MTTPKLDQFTRAYIEAALWSSTIAPFGECASCGKDKVLCQFAKDDTKVEQISEGMEWTLCETCGGDPGGNSYEPPADDNYSVEDLAPETLERMAADCAKFQEAHGELFTAEHYNGIAGHDFWLTRNGHGAGFWDGDWEEPIATRLTDASKAFGECNLYVGDDGKLYL
jgi:hypothetical protein